MTDAPEGTTAPPEDPAAVELLPPALRPEAYLAVERALQERLGLDGP